LNSAAAVEVKPGVASVVLMELGVAAVTEDSLLPLMPGVVRGSDGRINMKRAQATQAGWLVNSANVMDPATGGQPSTPNLHQRGYQISGQHHYVSASGALLTSQIAFERFDANLFHLEMASKHGILFAF
jgi:hypothetical protein